MSCDDCTADPGVVEILYLSYPRNMLLQTSWKCLSGWQSHIFRESGKRWLELDFFCVLTHSLFLSLATNSRNFVLFFFLQISGSWRSVKQSAAWFPLILPLSTLFRVWSYMTLLNYAYWLEQSDCVPVTTWPTNICMHLGLYACQGQSDSLVHGGETGVPS